MAVRTGYLNGSSVWTDVSVAKTVYTGAGRVDRTSLPVAVATADAISLLPTMLD